MHFTVSGAEITMTSIGVGVLASMAGIVFGYDTGQISGFVVMDDFNKRFAKCVDASNPATCTWPNTREGLVVGLLSIGCGVGALFGAKVSDTLGRTRAMSLECLVFTIGVVIQLASISSWEQFMVGRFVAGLGVGSLSAAVPVYQAETAPKQVRGTFTACYQLMITFGILVSNCFAVGTSKMSGSASWRIVLGLGLVFSTVLGLGVLVSPESPRWLVNQGRVDEAKSALKRLRETGSEEGRAAFEAEFNEMYITVKESQSLKVASWFDCFKVKDRILYRTLLGIALQSLQQLTGANYFFYYGTTVFNGVGLSNPFVIQIILGSVNTVSTFLGLYILERYGRRWPLIIGALWQSIWLFVFGGAGSANNPKTDKDTAKIMIVSACLFIVGFASTWGPCTWILIGESFPMRTRTRQGALATASNWVWNFLLAFFTPFITADIEYRYGFIFAACNFLGAVTVFFFCYETKGLSLEAVDMEYNDPNVKPWTSHNWVPPGYMSRQDTRGEVNGTVAPGKEQYSESQLEKQSDRASV